MDGRTDREQAGWQQKTERQRTDIHTDRQDAQTERETDGRRDMQAGW